MNSIFSNIIKSFREAYDPSLKRVPMEEVEEPLLSNLRKSISAQLSADQQAIENSAANRRLNRGFAFSSGDRKYFLAGMHQVSTQYANPAGLLILPVVDSLCRQIAAALESSIMKVPNGKITEMRIGALKPEPLWMRELLPDEERDIHHPNFRTHIPDKMVLPFLGRIRLEEEIREGNSDILNRFPVLNQFNTKAVNVSTQNLLAGGKGFPTNSGDLICVTENLLTMADQNAEYTRAERMLLGLEFLRSLVLDKGGARLKNTTMTLDLGEPYGAADNAGFGPKGESIFGITTFQLDPNSDLFKSLSTRAKEAKFGTGTIDSRKFDSRLMNDQGARGVRVGRRVWSVVENQSDALAIPGSEGGAGFSQKYASQLAALINRYGLGSISGISGGRNWRIQNDIRHDEPTPRNDGGFNIMSVCRFDNVPDENLEHTPDISTARRPKALTNYEHLVEGMHKQGALGELGFATPWGEVIIIKMVYSAPTGTKEDTLPERNYRLAYELAEMDAQFSAHWVKKLGAFQDYDIVEQHFMSFPPGNYIDANSVSGDLRMYCARIQGKGNVNPEAIITYMEKAMKEGRINHNTTESRLTGADIEGEANRLRQGINVQDKFLVTAGVYLPAAASNVEPGPRATSTEFIRRQAIARFENPEWKWEKTALQIGWKNDRVPIVQEGAMSYIDYCVFSKTENQLNKLDLSAELTARARKIYVR